MKVSFDNSASIAVQLLATMVLLTILSARTAAFPKCHIYRHRSTWFSQQALTASLRNSPTRCNTDQQFWRCYSAQPLHQELEEEEEKLDETREELLQPSSFFKEGKLCPPKALSPSSIIEFKNCPQSFLFQYIFGLKQDTNRVLVKGSMVHSALESLFDLKPEDRTIDNLHNLFRKIWSEHRMKEPYKTLFEDDSTGERDLPAEIAWGQESLKLLQNYMETEDPRMANPAQREIWVRAQLASDPFQGVTAPSKPNGATPDTFLVRGIVDRLDLVQEPGSREVLLRVIDYKTGKAPNLKYSEECNTRIRNESFFQLMIYALLMRENQPKEFSKMDLRHLRLFYLTTQGSQQPDGDAAKCLEFDLGATQEERDEKLFAVHQDLSKVWSDIHDLCATQDPTLWNGCDRSFCYCHKCRKRFTPGTVWEPDRLSP